jgi:hypothetical protein
MIMLDGRIYLTKFVDLTKTYAILARSEFAIKGELGSCWYLVYYLEMLEAVEEK